MRKQGVPASGKSQAGVARVHIESLAVAGMPHRGRHRSRSRMQRFSRLLCATTGLYWWLSSINIPVQTLASLVGRGDP
jgi:hypothetical protein